ncbi:MAG: hypothetical protein KAH67_04165 [Flavobacteriaceae bacterium]|nr:hypothetical protein [Flavobacteriaceae bacterium]
MGKKKAKQHKWIIKNYNWGKLGLELIVVFLGVTSGFLLNNWREQKQEKQIEQKYISSFIKDVSDNISDLESLTVTDSIWINTATPNLKLLQNKSLIEDSAKLVISRILQINKMDSHSGTYEDITNSGNLNLITNFDLKTNIVDYHLALKGVGFIDDHFYKYFNDFVMPFVFAEFNVLTGEFKNAREINNIRFSNIFTGYYSMVQQRNIAYKDILLKSYKFKEELLKRIEN